MPSVVSPSSWLASQAPTCGSPHIRASAGPVAAKGGKRQGEARRPHPLAALLSHPLQVGQPRVRHSYCLLQGALGVEAQPHIHTYPASGCQGVRRATGRAQRSLVPWCMGLYRGRAVGARRHGLRAAWAERMHPAGRSTPAGWPPALRTQPPPHLEASGTRALACTPAPTCTSVDRSRCSPPSCTIQSGRQRSTRSSGQRSAGWLKRRAGLRAPSAGRLAQQGAALRPPSPRNLSRSWPPPNSPLVAAGCWLSGPQRPATRQHRHGAESSPSRLANGGLFHNRLPPMRAAQSSGGVSQGRQTWASARAASRAACARCRSDRSVARKPAKRRSCRASSPPCCGRWCCSALCIPQPRRRWAPPKLPSLSRPPCPSPLRSATCAPSSCAQLSKSSARTQMQAAQPLAFAAGSEG